MALIVQKYGGTSVGTLDRIRKVVNPFFSCPPVRPPALATAFITKAIPLQSSA